MLTSFVADTTHFTRENANMQFSNQPIIVGAPNSQRHFKN